MTESSLTPLQHRTLKILVADTSAAQPITGTNIAKRIGLKQRTHGIEGGDMRSIIHALRVKGFPICATGRGYFYAHTEEQLSKFIVKLQNRLISQEEALKGLKESFHNIGGKVASNVSGVEFTVEKMAWNKQRTAVRKMRFPIGTNGLPVVPEGIELV